MYYEDVLSYLKRRKSKCDEIISEVSKEQEFLDEMIDKLANKSEEQAISSDNVFEKKELEGLKPILDIPDNEIFKVEQGLSTEGIFEDNNNKSIVDAPENNNIYVEQGISTEGVFDDAKLDSKIDVPNEQDSISRMIAIPTEVKEIIVSDRYKQAHDENFFEAAGDLEKEPEGLKPVIDDEPKERMIITPTEVKEINVSDRYKQAYGESFFHPAGEEELESRESSDGDTKDEPEGLKPVIFDDVNKEKMVTKVVKLPKVEEIAKAGFIPTELENVNDFSNNADTNVVLSESDSRVNPELNKMIQETILEENNEQIDFSVSESIGKIK